MGTSRCVDLYLVRHGLTDWNKERRYLGHTDRDVLVEELGKLSGLKKELSKLSFNAVYTSDLIRCQSTLNYLNLSKVGWMDNRLREMNFGEWEGKTYEELKGKPAYRKWIDNWEQGRTPSGESGLGFKRRVNAFVGQLLESGVTGNILVVTHGGVIRYILAKFRAVNSFWESPAVGHGQCLRMRLIEKEGEWTCNSLSVVPSVAKETL